MAAEVVFFQDLLLKVTLGVMLPIIINNKIEQALLTGQKLIRLILKPYSPTLSHLESYGLFSFDQESQKWSYTELSYSFINSMCNAYSINLILSFYYISIKFQDQVEIRSKCFSNTRKREIFEEMKKVLDALQRFQVLMKAFTDANEEPLINATGLTGINSFSRCCRRKWLAFHYLDIKVSYNKVWSL